MKILFIVSFHLAVLRAQDIIYEEGDDTCQLPDGGSGICRESTLCPGAFENFPRVRPVTCGFNGRIPIVCCSVKTDRVTDSPVLEPLLDISPPDLGPDFFCGESELHNSANTRSSGVAQSESKQKQEIPVPILLPSDTPNLRFSPPGTNLEHSDPFPNYMDYNDTILAAVGGIAARNSLVKYAALIGQRDPSGNIDWFCTGVLLNHQWVLTAAHCAAARQINVVRLGEYDFASENDDAYPEDFDVTEIVLYPEYTPSEGYHDLALLRLSESLDLKVYFFINPVCLPWGDAIRKDLVNEKITLTGWGATQFGGGLSSVPQEVNITVFHSSLCDESYSELRIYNLEFPRGIDRSILCAGDVNGGKDACQGDSGGPVVYLNENKLYVLAGVVSKGYGCGSKDFPGLYANIHHTPYLAWIKRVAFL